jgi:hypothetical protein
VEHNNETNVSTHHIHDIEALNALVSHPFEISESEESNDLDPDNNFFLPTIDNSLTTCKYYNIDQINNDISVKQSNQFSILGLNIRSLPKNHRELNSMLHIIDTKFHAIILTETWLKEHNIELYNIDDYSHEHQIRQDKDGGGVSIFIKENINFKVRADLNFNSNDYQLLCVVHPNDPWEFLAV